MARPSKSLLDLVRDNTFRPGRHRLLLETQRLPKEAPDWVESLVVSVWPQLVRTQRHYIKSKRTDGPLTREYLSAFSCGVRALHGGDLPWLLGG